MICSALTEGFQSPKLLLQRLLLVNATAMDLLWTLRSHQVVH